MFENEPITAFKQNKNIPEIIGTYWIENRRVKKDLKSLREGKCTPCRAKTGNMLRTSKNYCNIQESTNNKNLEDISL